MSAGVKGARPRDPGRNVGRPRAGLADGEGVPPRGMRLSRCDVVARVQVGEERRRKPRTELVEPFRQALQSDSTN